MRILEELPSREPVWIRVHATPALLPRHDDEVTAAKDVKPWLLDYASNHAGYATCLAESLFPHGCARFCRGELWDRVDLMLVCRHWRSIIRSCPRFWSDIVVENEDTVARSLKLSGATPLRVKIDGVLAMPPSQQAIASVLHQLSRVETLEVGTFVKDSQYRSTVEHVLGAFTSSPAPVLRELNWSAQVRHDVSTQHWKQRRFPFLQTLVMHTINLSHPCSLLSPTLVNLTLTRCSPPWTTANEMFETLGCMPMLELLFLWELPDIPDFEADHFRILPVTQLPISLPRLHTLNLDGSYRYVYRVFRSLQISPIISALNFKCSHKPYGLNPTSDIVQIHASLGAFAKAVAASGIVFSFLEFSIDLDVGGMNIAVSGNDCRRFYWRHTWDPQDANFAGAILDFLQGIARRFVSKSTVTDLRVSVAGEFIADGWFDLTPRACFSWLAEFPSIANLHLAGEAASHFIPWMRYHLHEAKEASLPFPALRHLIITSTSLVGNLDPSDLADDPTNILFKHLWLYFHDQRPETVLKDVEMTFRMHKYLSRMLGPWLDVDTISHVDGPCVRMEVAPHDQLYISFPPSMDEILIETPYDSY
ncbi:unnamed protein product [Peniophora sp. CBMAI 1063]|nr:unnamed protein product [Peniophora sp. CBMAI 1063]